MIVTVPGWPGGSTTRSVPGGIGPPAKTLVVRYVFNGVVKPTRSVRTGAAGQGLTVIDTVAEFDTAAEESTMVYEKVATPAKA